MLILAASTQITSIAQNTEVNSKAKETELKPAPVTSETIKKDFVELAGHRIVDNEKSVNILKKTQNIKDDEVRALYNENVLIFEKRNNEMKEKIKDFNVNATRAQQMEFIKRWNWAMDELSVFEKNLMTENFLHK